MASETKFTVIVPTRERPDTLRYCLQTIARQDYDNLQIIVSDNFSQDETEQVVRDIGDSRIRYINTGRRISMSHNWEFALSHVDSGWVTFLGDDDGLLPNALIKVNEIIQQTTCKAVTTRAAHYGWPDFGDGANQLVLSNRSGYEIRDSKQRLLRVMDGYDDRNQLPGIYIYGFVDFSVINKARDNNGRFFCSMIPDVYANMAISSLIDKYVYMYEPVSICGGSKHSNGASSLGMSGNSSPAEQFYSEENIPFHALLGTGRVKSIPVIIYECYLQSLHLHHDFAKIQMEEQLARCIQPANMPHYEEIVRYCKEVAESNGLNFATIKSSARRIEVIHKVRSLLTMKFMDYMVSDLQQLGVRNVFEASWVAAGIYFQIMHNKNWKRKRIVLKLGNFFSFPSPR